MNKEKAKKYIQSRRDEIICELEITKSKMMGRKLSTEYNFLSYAMNVIDFAENISGLTDECDVIPAPTTFEYKGYILQQSNYNNHYMIFKDGEIVMHYQCNQKLNQKGAEKSIDFYIDMISGKYDKG